MPKVLIGTLFSGEAELDSCAASIAQQSFKQVHHEIIRFLPNKEAHETLYQMFMAHKNEYDYFIKLDADMSFRDIKAIEKIVDYMEDHLGLDHLVLSVHDYYTESSISGVHVFSNRCTWNESPDKVFVDHNPEIPGHRELFYTSDITANLVTHAFLQNDNDAIAFGVHKFSKVLQNQDYPYSYSQLLNHWGNINLLVRRFKEQNDQTRKLAISAVYSCMCKSINGELRLNQDNYKKSEKYILNTPVDIEKFVNSRNYRKLLLIKLLGIKKSIYMALYKLYRKYQTGEAQYSETPNSLRTDTLN